MTTTWLASALMLLAALLTLLAAVGLVRLPDLFTRMHAATKSASLGVVCMMLAAMVHFADLGVGARALLVIVFVVLTAPVAAHTIGRAAYFVGVRLWEGTVVDDLRDRYDPRSHRLDRVTEESAAEPAPAHPRSVHEISERRR